MTTVHTRENQLTVNTAVGNIDPAQNCHKLTKGHPYGSIRSGQQGQRYNTAIQQQTGMAQGPAGTSNVTPAKKSVFEAYLLWMFAGILGVHHFYLERTFFAYAYLFTLGLFGVGLIIDLCRIPYLVHLTNQRILANSPTNEKYVSDAYVLWFPFGIVGLHHFYLGNVWHGVLYFFTFGVFGIGWLIDLFRMPSLVKEANEPSGEIRQKRVCLAYLLTLPPHGIFGCHHFYLNRPITGVVYMFTLGLCGVGWFVDVFRLTILVKRADEETNNGRFRRKHLDDAYLFWFPLGILGLHQFYLNRPAWGVLYFLTLGLFGIGWLGDGFRMPCLVQEFNMRHEVISEQPPVTRHRPSVVSVEDSGRSYNSISNYGYAGVQSYDHQVENENDHPYHCPG